MRKRQCNRVGRAAPISAYLDPANAGGVLQSYSDQLADYMRKNENNPGLSAAQALADFRALPAARQMPFIEQVYFAELKAGGEAAANGQGAGGKGYDRAYKAIQILFPGSTPGTPNAVYNGDVSLYGLSRIRTEAGGDINIMAPGGGVTLGFENQTPNLSGQTDTARPGLLTLRGGNVTLFTETGVIVAQSRVFTELGGDILMFSTNGDLNAGKGKKTSLVTSPPQFTVDPLWHRHQIGGDAADRGRHRHADRRAGRGTGQCRSVRATRHHRCGGRRHPCLRQRHAAGVADPQCQQYSGPGNIDRRSDRAGLAGGCADRCIECDGSHAARRHAHSIHQRPAVRHHRRGARLWRRRWRRRTCRSGRSASTPTRHERTTQPKSG
jgi:hypothetical protein